MDPKSPIETFRQCPTCDVGRMHPMVVTERFPYEDDGTEVTVVAENVPIERCDNPDCREELSGPEAARIRHEAICRALGLLTPAEIRAVREGLNLTQAEFARLTRLGEATISRWERGRLLQNPAMDRYLRLIARCDDNVRFLQKLRESHQQVTPEPHQATSNRMTRHFRGLKNLPDSIKRPENFCLHHAGMN